MAVPTLRDVAALAGVHPATASRALNPGTKALVNDGTAERVIRAAERLGYRPNPIARSLKTARSSSIGVIIPDLTNPLFPPIVRGIDDALYARGYSSLIVNTDNDARHEERLVSSLRSRNVDGFIVATARLEHPLLDELVAERVPLVLVNRRLDDLPVPSVTADDAAGIHLAVRHLAELGHRRIAHVAGPQDTSTGVIRARAFRDALQELGLTFDPALVRACTTWSETEGQRALHELLDAGDGFTAVLAGNDLVALGCYDALLERGLSCPGDLSIVGFNDMPFVDKLRPPLTTVHIPHYAIGRESAALLLERLGNPDQPAKSVLLPLTLTVRASTAAVVTAPRPRRSAAASRSR